MLSPNVKQYTLSFRRSSEKISLTEEQYQKVSQAWAGKVEPIILTDPDTRETKKVFSYKDIESIDKLDRVKGEYTIYIKDTVLGKGKLHNGTEVFVMLFERRYINGDGIVSSWHSYFLNGSENKISVSEAQEILSRK